MRTGVIGFQRDRLIQARESLGITRVAMATLVGVSPATITNWEKGTQLPSQDKLQALSQAVKFQSSWFLSEPPEQETKPYFFRSLSSATKTAREMAKIRLNWVAESTSILGRWLNWPEVKVPAISEEQFLTITDLEIESLAVECRQSWGLGLGPIQDVILALENAGIIVARSELGYLKMDGVSHWHSDSRPYIFIASDKANGIRNRFDAAHELGHLILHRNVDETTFKKHYKEIERQADLFAGCFLLPAESFASDVSWPTIETLLSLKQRWKASVASMIMRCYQLDIIDDDQKQRLFKSYSARGWRRGEPYDDQLQPECPRLLNRAVDLLVNQKVVTKGELLYQLGLPQHLAESLCGLAEGYFDERNFESNLVELRPKLKPASHSSKKEHNGKVVYFPNR